LVGRVGAKRGVFGEALFDDGDDFEWGRVWAGCGDAAAVAEGFEVWNFAGGVEGGEFFDGFWKWDLEGVDDFHGVPFVAGAQHAKA